MAGQWTRSAWPENRCACVGFLLVLGVFCLGISAVGAEEWESLESRKLTLDECLSIAEENSPSLGMSWGEIMSARATKLSAWSEVLPHLSNRSGVSRSEYESPWWVAGKKLIYSDKIYSNSIYLEQLIFDAGGSIASISGANASLRAAESEHLSSKLDLALLVKANYIELLKTRALLEVRQEAVDLSQQHHESAEAFYRAGEKTKADVLRARVELAQNQMELISARNSVQTARAKLCHSLGIPVETNLDVADLAEPAVFREVDLEGVLEEVLQKHPALKARRDQITSASEGVKEAKRSRWPRVTGYCQYNWNDIAAPATSGLHKWSANAEWRLGVSLNLNIFDGLQTKSNIRFAEASMKSASEQYRLAVNDVALEIKESHLALIEALERIRAAEDAVVLGEEDRRLQEERYRLGEGTLLELNDALVALTEARVSRVGAIYDYHLAKARLDRAVGRD